MVPEIWSVTDIIFCHSEPFFALLPPMDPENKNFEKMKKKKNTWRYYYFTNVYHKWQSYDAWFLRYQAQQTEFFVILDRFLPFYTPNNLKNKNFEKMKKETQDIIILHRCTISDNHMMYGSWDMEHDEHNFLSCWTVFCLFAPLTTQKIKILKNWKNILEILSFYTGVP